MTDYSAEAIAHRLKSVSEARRLGLSLERAGVETRARAGGRSGADHEATPHDDAERRPSSGRDS